jgi:4-hydroxybenzoyl-CoA thioesterase/acyl-CoA thioester hydrolase
MSEVFKSQRRVEFRDTDMAGIVHFSNFFAYMEQAEHALLRSLGLGVICDIDGETISFPRVNAECNYRNAIKFEEIIDIHVVVTRIGSKSITYGFNFFRDETPVADGSITVVCCHFDHGPKPSSVPTPEGFLKKLRPYLIDESSAQS